MRGLTAIWRQLAGLCLLLLLLPTTAAGKIVYYSNQRASREQIIESIRNSPTADPWLRQRADTVYRLVSRVESGGRLHVYNGSCCFGLYQLNRSNIRHFAHMSPDQYKLASLQTQRLDGADFASFTQPGGAPANANENLRRSAGNG